MKNIYKITLLIAIFAAVFAFFVIKSPNATQSKMPVGVILSLTGPAQYFGEETKKGMDLANQGNEVNFVFEDSRSDATTAVSAYNKLKSQNNIKAVILSLSNVANAVVPITEKDKMFSVQNLVSARKVAGEMSVRYFTSAEQEAPIMAGFAVNNLKMKKVAILASTDEYGKTYAEVFRNTFENAGGSVVESESYDKKDQDFKTQLMKIKVSGATGVYIIGLDTHLVSIFKQMNELGLNQVKMTNWVMASPSVQSKVGPNAEGVYMTTPEYYTSDNAKVKNFTEAYQKKYNSLPSAYSAIGYDMVGLFREATKTGDSSQDIMNNMKSIKDFDGLMGKLNISNTGEITIPLMPAKIENGKMVLVK
jgi:branched-chain amino acid transport system substrate-binding protein